MSQTIPTIRAWAVVPAGGGQPALCLDRTRAEQIAPAMRGVIVELSSTAPMAPALVPLSDEQLWASDEIMSMNADLGWHMDTIRMFVRATERLHGIKP